MTAVKRRYRQYVTCWGCRRPNRRHEGHGLCRACRGRYDDETGELRPPMPPQESGRRGALHLIESKANRLEDFAHLADWDVSDEEAAERLNVSPRTIGRYRAALRDGLQLRFPAGAKQAS